jgi:GAF domain-containing protein
MSNTTMTVAVPDIAGADMAVSDQQLLRIRRIAKRAFKVEKCILKFDDAQIGFVEGQQSKASIEAQFCASQPLASVLLVVPDTQVEPLMAQHPMVTGAPHIRFYATCPIYNEQGALVGSINLVDGKPHTFSENDRLALRDMARMVERELYARLINARRQYLEQKTRNLRRKSLIDPLIGTWNRGAIMRILAIESARCDKMGVPLSVIVLDLDFF